MVRSIETRAEVEELFAARKEQHDARGIAATRLEILRLDWPSDGTAVGHVRWVHEDEEGREIGAESSTYVLCRDHVGTLKVRVVVMEGVEGSQDTSASSAGRSRRVLERLPP